MFWPAFIILRRLMHIRRAAHAAFRVDHAASAFRLLGFLLGHGRKAKAKGEG